MLDYALNDKDSDELILEISTRGMKWDEESTGKRRRRAG
jgi:hypothetical protein